MSLAATSLFNFVDQAQLRSANVERLTHALSSNSERIAATASGKSTDDLTSKALADAGAFHHALGASLRVNHFITSQFLFDQIW